MKKKVFKIVVICVLIVGLLTGIGIAAKEIVSEPNAINTRPITIVIDAGHGGIDGGCVGASGTKESDLNLKYAYSLGTYLSAMGIKIVYTRTSSDGLYSQTATDKKKDDMARREEIVNNIKPQAVISIHMNKFADKSQCGAQVFYSESAENGENLANAIRDSLVKNVKNARPLTLVGDYYMVNCTTAPSVIVECGFLSNPEEEALLKSKEYEDKLCYSIFEGVVRYLGLKINF